MTGPLIGVTRGRRSGASFTPYLDSVVEAGGRPTELYPGAAACGDLEQVVETIQGLVLIGGRDVGWQLYASEKHPETGEADEARDQMELSLIRLALARDLPVFAICRGFQILNVALGGALLQHIEDGLHAAHETEGYPSRFHPLEIAPASRLARLIGAGSIETNSRHHQGVLPADLAPGLAISAMSPDGLVEGVEAPAQRWMLGLQCHPERDEVRDLFGPVWRDFIAAANVTSVTNSPSSQA